MLSYEPVEVYSRTGAWDRRQPPINRQPNCSVEFSRKDDTIVQFVGLPENSAKFGVHTRKIETMDLISGMRIGVCGAE